MRILLTRPRGDDELAALLEAAGFGVARVPAIATVPEPALRDAVTGLAGYDWVVVTSATAVEALRDAGGARDGAAPLPAEPPRWAAVGPATAAALAALDLPVAAVPSSARGAAIPDVLEVVAPLDGARILLPRADAADTSLPEALRARGAHVAEVVAYHTIEGPESSRAPLAHALADPDLGAAVVASGSAARGLVVLAAAGGPATTAALASLAFVSIGPSTSAEVRRLGLRLVAEAASPTPQSIAEAVASAVPLGHSLETVP